MKRLIKEKIQLRYLQGLPFQHKEEISITMSYYYWKNFRKLGVKGDAYDKLVVSYKRIGNTKTVLIDYGKEHSVSKIKGLSKELQYRLNLNPEITLNMWLGSDSYLYYEELLG